MFVAKVARIGDAVEFAYEDDHRIVITVLSIKCAVELGEALLQVATGDSVVTDDNLHQLIEDSEEL